MNEFKVSSQDLKNYITSSRSCSILDSGCVLNPIHGRVVLDLSGFHKADYCDIQIKRDHGDGRIVIKSGDIVNETRVLSTYAATINAKLHGDKIINIYRPERSKGKVVILGFTVGEIINEAAKPIIPSVELGVVAIPNTSPISMPPSIPKVLEKMNAQDWRAIMAKCGKYARIRGTKEGLFASEGGYLQSNKIQTLITNPPNCFVNNGNFFKFITACKILNIQLADSSQIVTKPAIQLFQHLEAPSPITTDPQAHSLQQDILPIKNVLIPVPKIQTSYSSTIYDSLSADGLNANKLTNAINISSRGGLILGRNGSFCIPLSNLKQYIEYVVFLTIKKINGNGKAMISIGTIEGSKTFIRSSSVVVASHSEIEHCVRLKSGGEPLPGHTFCINVQRPHATIGEILVKRIRVIEENSYVPEHNEQEKYVFDNSFENPDTVPCPYIEQIKFPNLTRVPVSKYTNIKLNTNRKFVIVIPSYNNAKWVEKNLTSAINQDYPYYRIIYIDDCSSDGTFAVAKDIVKKFNADLKVLLIRNQNRIGALQNLFNMIHSCADDEIVLTLDGDDWLENKNVLLLLNNKYKSGDVWMTYGQYKNYPDGGRGISQPIPHGIISSNAFRKFTWCASHLRTFYAWLFKRIKAEDLMYNGTFMSMTWDFAMMFPMLEMAEFHSSFMADILYVYNLENPINDHKVDRNFQKMLDGFVRRKQKYTKIPPSQKPKGKINAGLMLIATGKYQGFINPLISSADRYFLNSDDIDVTYFIFSDKENNFVTNRDIKQILIEHRPFPYASMDRFKHFTKNATIFDGMDYLFYVDVDCLFVDHVNEEIFGNLVGVRHCGYYNGGGTFETNPKSVFFAPYGKYKHYYGGGFSGGKKDEYLRLSYWCSQKIDEDLANGIVPLWHDETALNRFFLDNPPEVSLTPSYHFPQGNIEHYKKLWTPNSFEPKILLLEKNHKEIRE